MQGNLHVHTCTESSFPSPKDVVKHCCSSFIQEIKWLRVTLVSSLHLGRCVRVQNEKSKKETCTWPITGLHRRKACHPLTFPPSLWSHGGPSTSASRAKEGNWRTQEEERRRKAGKLKGRFLGKRGFFCSSSSSCGSSGGSDFPWVGGLIPCPSLFVTDLRKDVKPGVCVNRWMRNR